MAAFIFIDGGTTSTRLRLVKDGTITLSEKLNIGAGSTKGSDNSALAGAVKEGIASLLRCASLGEKDVEAAVFSGMICSEIGLFCVPHIEAPASRADLARASVRTSLPEISAVPFCFIPGVKRSSKVRDVSGLCDVDLMRGEECEYFGLTKALGVKGGVTVVLPGSHNKVIHGDENTIFSFSTTLSGEMASALSKGTILKNSFSLTAQYDEKYLVSGYEYCREHGINRALFGVRLLEKTFHPTEAETSSFFMGEILCGDVEAVKAFRKNENTPVIVGGSEPLKSELALLLRHSGVECICAEDEICDNAAAFGAMEIITQR